MAKQPKRPRDTMQLAKFIGEKATGEQPGDKDQPARRKPAKRSGRNVAKKRG